MWAQKTNLGVIPQPSTLGFFSLLINSNYYACLWHVLRLHHGIMWQVEGNPAGLVLTFHIYVVSVDQSQGC